MYHRTHYLLTFFLCLAVNPTSTYAKQAQEQSESQGICSIENRTCIIEEIKRTAVGIDNEAWKDQTYREIAKTYAFEGNFDKAVAILPLITTPDTKAMTIRGIGMAIAKQKHTEEDLNRMFTRLLHESGQIKHPPSNAIALTYVAMAQAFAGDNEGAWKTAASMENTALRHKALGETAEIQAEKGDDAAAKTSIEKIESLAFKNKAYSIVSKIFADQGEYSKAYNATQSITNAYKKTQSLQYILDKQKPRDLKHK